jgi:hypothetical protein
MPSDGRWDYEQHLATLAIWIEIRERRVARGDGSFPRFQANAQPKSLCNLARKFDRG